MPQILIVLAMLALVIGTQVADAQEPTPGDMFKMFGTMMNSMSSAAQRQQMQQQANGRCPLCRRLLPFRVSQQKEEVAFNNGMGFRRSRWRLMGLAPMTPEFARS